MVTGTCAKRPRAATKSGWRNMSVSKKDGEDQQRSTSSYTPSHERVFVHSDRHQWRKKPKNKGKHGTNKQRCGLRPTYEPGERDLRLSLSCTLCKNFENREPRPRSEFVTAGSDIRCTRGSNDALALATKATPETIAGPQGGTSEVPTREEEVEKL